MTGPAQAFLCSQCGAQMQFDAASRGMACPYCSYKQAVAMAPPGGGGGMVREIPLEQGMQFAQRGLGAPVTTIQCRDCGATVHVGQGERTTKCAFCGSQTVLQTRTDESLLRPESLVPFGIARDAANQRFGAWLSSLWLRPSDLKKMAEVQEMGGVYVPYWTFNALVYSQWSAERGHHYYETETYTATENGQSVTRQRQVQRTRWEPAYGSRNDTYENVLVCAGRGLPTALADKFTSFDVAQLVPYQPGYLAGWRAEQYALDLMPGWQQGQGKIAAQQEHKCARDVGGDTHRSLTVQNQFGSVTFKHVLLPIWIAAYRYGGKTYQFLVNGQTGEVVGKAPWSVVKITMLVAVVVAVIVAIVVVYQYAQPDQ